MKNTIKILALADEESKFLWDYFQKESLQDIDLILACGDLKASYLSFLATFSCAPILYVHGNHDTTYEEKPPEGCICIEDKIYVHKGLRIAGLGGSVRYKQSQAPFCQYEEKEMAKRVAKMKNRAKRFGGIDILITHSPARGLNDGDDRPHMGFSCFHDLLDVYPPKVFVHGHVHMNYGNFPREAWRGDTKVINAFQKYIFEIEIPQTETTSSKEKCFFSNMKKVMRAWW